MPVRIYDISKKLGLQNKEILAKAKSLGIAAARVPSSSLDKITAEDLENHLLEDHPELAAKFAAPPVVEIPKPAPIEEKVVFITAPPPEPPKPEVKEEPPPVIEAPKPPPPPPKPAGPKIGEKVGFIQLPTRPQPRSGDKTGPAKLPSSRQGGPQRTDSRQPFQRSSGGRQSAPPAREPAKPAAPQPKFVAPATGEIIVIKPPIVVREQIGRAHV